ncbi:MAG: SDR family oxidoreductase [Candidatus Heimdallarchaeota archaeon]|nr:SDR family oxidoreductase [Candidatus Heimdallarchaeota archaeon]MBY8993332.1 SDR family oxidoreductase [Candidatus Heimdallarchaeota archaeon]
MNKIDSRILEKISLQDKVAIVTGGSSGIGLASAELLAEVGATVVILDINESAGKNAVEKITKTGGTAKFLYCDVSSDSDCKKTIQAIHKEFGRIDVLFNNAGVMRRRNVVNLEEDDWDLMINVNLKSIYLLSRYVIPIMIEGKGGSIINNGSGWGIKGGPNAVAYCAAKGGVVNMTRAMAIDFGKQGVRVNCVCPGDVDTPLLRGEAAQIGMDEEEFMKEAADRPLGRVGDVKDVAHAVLYLASDLSSWVTGTFLIVDGGGLA